jgi:pyridoxal phosphate enzyme (YggS family)
MLDRADIRWHMIGHLQRNKVRAVVPRATLIHSLDSLRLAKAINDESRRNDCTTRCLIEINISGDSSKHGFQPNELEPALEKVAELTNLCVCGLMAMSGLDSTEDESLREFNAVREIRDSLQQSMGNRYLLTELSMGMSGDFSHAVAAGSTIVRIGSALFE